MTETWPWGIQKIRKQSQIKTKEIKLPKEMDVTFSSSCSGIVFVQLYWNRTWLSNMCLITLTAYSVSASVSSTGDDD